MGLLINDELIWISIPRSASHSIESALINSDLNIKKHSSYNKMVHPHVQVQLLFEEFGIKDTICIKRNWFEKWMSALRYVIMRIEHNGVYTTKIKWENYTNDYIYKTFDTEFINNIHSIDDERMKESLFKLINETELSDTDENHSVFRCLTTLLSANFFKTNNTCTYEFEMNELNLFNQLIENRFGVKLKIEKINESFDRKSKIVADNDFKKWVWDNFELNYIKNNTKKSLI